jgi:hypothetical protein
MYCALSSDLDCSSSAYIEVKAMLVVLPTTVLVCPSDQLDQNKSACSTGLILLFVN